MSSPQTSVENNLEATRLPYSQPRPKLPLNFPHILKEYAREVLRAQPPDLLEWSAEYFKALALQSDPSCQRRPTPPPSRSEPNAKVSPPPIPPSAMMTEKEENSLPEVLTDEKLLLVLSSLDESNSGFINVQLLRREFIKRFKLSPVQYLFLLTAPSTTITQREDLVEYEPFVKQSVFLLRFLQKVEEGFQEALQNMEGEVEVHGLNRENLEREFLNHFYTLDSGHTGRLSWGEYRNAILDAPIPLTGRDVRIICIECEHHSKEYGEEVDYENEVHYLFDRLLLSYYLNEFDAKVVEGL